MRRNRETGAIGSPRDRKWVAGTALSLALGITSFATLLSIPSDALAADNTGSKARVSLSARLRSLSEDVSASACRIQAGIDPEESTAHLKTVRDTFDVIISGLENGDKRLGIPTAEQRGSLIKRIARVNDLWSPVKSALDDMINGTSSADDYAIVYDTFRDLQLETEQLATDISGAYSDPVSLLQSDAITLNFLGRQRTLVTRIARTTCAIYSDIPAIGTQEELNETVDILDKSFQALIDGFPAAGVKPPPSEAVKSVLQEVYDLWKLEEVDLDQNMNSPETVPEAVSHSADFAADAVQKISNAITLYLIASPGQENVFQAALEQYAREQLLAWLDDPAVIDSIKEQNAANTNLSQDDIDLLDKEWRAEATGEEGTLISETLAKPLSTWLAAKQSATAGIVTEVFVMDNKGLNVGQSAPTSDYWQGDEAKWQETFGKAQSEMHIGDLEFDESSRSYQTQASQLIVDPDSGEPIGAVTFGINVINLM